MPIALGLPGFAMTREERIAELIAAAGGPTKAAKLIGRTRTHIDNMRKPDAVLRLDDLVPLCVEAGVSLDWVATGYQVREDLMFHPGLAETDADLAVQGDFAQLMPARPERLDHAGRRVDRFAPSPMAVRRDWLQQQLGLVPDEVRYAMVEDNGMAPTIGAGAFVLVDVRPAPLRSGLFLVGFEEVLARRLIRLPDGRAELVADAHPSWRFTLQPDSQPDILFPIVWVGQAVWPGGR